MTVWEEFRQHVLQCKKCELHTGRTNVVFGEGGEYSKIMFVGEGPGRDEDAQGRPFVGAAGKLLTQMIQEIGMQREDVFIANIVKCRPPQNRDPRPEEIAACKEYLIAQIAHINPQVICTLGRHSLHTLVSEDLVISKVHGQPIRHKGKLFMPMYHPAAALYNRSQLMEPLRQDFLRLRDIVENIHPSS